MVIRLDGLHFVYGFPSSNGLGPARDVAMIALGGGDVANGFKKNGRLSLLSQNVLHLAL